MTADLAKHLGVSIALLVRERPKGWRDVVVTTGRMFRETGEKASPVNVAMQTLLDGLIDGENDGE